MILEYCSGTLKEKVINDGYDNPAKLGWAHSEQLKQMEEMAHLMIQICEGLRYIHRKDMIHRDLKLENILVSKFLVFLVYSKKFKVEEYSFKPFSCISRFFQAKKHKMNYEWTLNTCSINLNNVLVFYMYHGYSKD